MDVIIRCLFNALNKWSITLLRDSVSQFGFNYTKKPGSSGNTEAKGFSKTLVMSRKQHLCAYIYSNIRNRNTLCYKIMK